MQLGHSGVFVSRLTGKCKAKYKTHSTLVIVKLYKIWRMCDETAFRGMISLLSLAATVMIVTGVMMAEELINWAG